MKRETATKYVHELSRRVHSVGGLLLTPECHFTGVRVFGLWVFGSYVKGALNPTDLDILIDWRYEGKSRVFELSDSGIYPRCYGPYPWAEKAMYNWLTKGMVRVSRHHYSVDKRLAVPRFMIYPTMEWEEGETVAMGPFPKREEDCEVGA